MDELEKTAKVPVCIKKSEVDGLGLFAVEPIVKGTKIAYFTGVEMTYKEIKERYGNDWRCIYKRMPWQTQIVSKDCKNLINFVNDGVHNQKIPKFNCILKRRWLVAIEDIPAGQELLLKYPESYWKFWA